MDVVLMDIMMPRHGRLRHDGARSESSQVRSLPIIALTAKAMKGDREKCIEPARRITSASP